MTDQAWESRIAELEKEVKSLKNDLKHVKKFVIMLANNQTYFFTNTQNAIDKLETQITNIGWDR